MSILDDARAVIANGPVCDACLGRVFADRSFGLTNDERGHALRVASALDTDEPFESSEGPDACWVCEGECGRYDALAERAVDALDGIEFATYQVGTRVPPLIEENDRLLREDSGLPADTGESFKSALNREVGKRVGERTDTEVDFERPDVLALVNLERGDVDAQINPAFVYGRYRKLDRDIPQTEWPCRECGGGGTQLAADGGTEPCDYCGGSGYLYDESVEELTAPVVEDAMDGADAVFHGAGREDVDARMLGTGRPFVIEVKEPHQRAIDTADLEAAINDFADDTVEVEGLRRATHEMVERVKEHDAHKTYSMAVEFTDPVTESEFTDALAALDGATIDQHTPERVDHRRASRTRERTVYEIDGELEPDRTGDDEDGARHATVELRGEGGLYVKELVSGDDDRTEPSLAGLLGIDATVTALDVLAVEGEDEPFATAEYVIGADGDEPDADEHTNGGESDSRRNG
ncbi:tRNA pseudouridine(54/55) synthase Pus10 [Halococcus saccharolyticus]|uniref:tRNA pseudouridine synthase Pus10 n=1 Tax=Halococcus saccharolyticus DSM 5350 TaxID=1227455 RepID=M0MFC3_9EURY|nr:tRNA pseudouridine(54/55) synthase Pus10 [Halococcus saccharolyticus]EMA43120.1 pseudouridylate synthase [Halococcus saccharolyticus DSM 5350]